jgi:hypothetical protein
LAEALHSIRTIRLTNNFVFDFCSIGSKDFKDLNYNCYKSGTSIGTLPHETYIHHTTYAFFVERLLLLAADVELNPGPSTETQNILDAIAAANLKTSEEIKDVKSEVVAVRSEVLGVKIELASMKDKIERMEAKQKCFDDKLLEFENNLDQNEYMREVVYDDIRALDDKFEKHCEVCEKLENQLDKLEMESRKGNLRIFGLSEEDGENLIKLKTSIIDNVCLKARPDDAIRISDIAFARRLGDAKGDAKGDQPRTVLVKFKDPDIKFSLLSGRDSLREQGIRIANDLTSRQHSILKQLKSKGKRGYFKGGKIHIISPEEEETSDAKNVTVSTRIFRKRPKLHHNSDSEAEHDLDNSFATVIDRNENREPIEVDC